MTMIQKWYLYIQCNIFCVDIFMYIISIFMYIISKLMSLKNSNLTILSRLSALWPFFFKQENENQHLLQGHKLIKFLHLLKIEIHMYLPIESITSCYVTKSNLNSRLNIRLRVKSSPRPQTMRSQTDCFSTIQTPLPYSSSVDKVLFPFVGDWV